MSTRRPLTDQVAAALAPGSRLADALPGFEPRPGQQELANEVARTIDAGGLLVAEAGTGTGKTLAYLIPAALSGRRVLISTGTRTLQDQISYKDVPTLSAALGRDVRATYMKGRANYLCRHRYDRVRESAPGLQAADRRWLVDIGEWAAETTTGDRAEIEGLPDDFPLWADLSATSEQCLGRECPQFADCFITKMRERAAESDLVIVNHHLLCADAAIRQGSFGEVIPECDVLIVDEAHQLEDVVTQYFGVSLGAHRLDELARDATKEAGLIPAEQGRWAVSIVEAATELQEAGRRLFDAARVELRQQAGRGERMTISPDVAERLRGPGVDLDGALAALQRAIARDPDPPEALAAAAERAGALRRDAGLLVAASDPAYVYFIEARGRGASLRAAPIEVAGLVRDAILAGRQAAILTSATLTVEGRFDYVAGRLGTSGATTIRLPSEFDYRSQTLLYLPADMPDPRSPEFNEAAAWTIAHLLDCSEGRAFVLFTSYAAMHDVYAALAPRTSWPLLVQGSAPRHALLRDFRATPGAVLLATSSFWQGVDVAGDALSCVIVDRLPFASPGDPIVAARIAAIQARGGHPFNDYQVPLATLALKQGLGRLIRTRTDRGILAVLDPRLTRMRYGQRFLASLPSSPITTDLGRVAEFMKGPSDM